MHTAGGRHARPRQRTSPSPLRKVLCRLRGMLIAFLGDSLTEGWPGAAYFPLLERGCRSTGCSTAGAPVTPWPTCCRACGTRGSSPSTAPSSGSAPTTPSSAPGTRPTPGSGWSWPERLARLAGDYEELLEWTEARAPRIVRGAARSSSRRRARCGRSGRPRSPRPSQRSRPRAAPAAWSTCARRSRPRATPATGPSRRTACTSRTPGAGVVARAFAAVIAALESEDGPGGGRQAARHGDEEA